MPRCSLPEFRSTSDPETSNVMFQGRRRKRTPDDNYDRLYTAREARDDVPDDARSASSKVTRHHGLRAREQMAGDSWQETDRPIALRRTDLDNKELFEISFHSRCSKFL